MNDLQLVRAHMVDGSTMVPFDKIHDPCCTSVARLLHPSHPPESPNALTPQLVALCLSLFLFLSSLALFLFRQIVRPRVLHFWRVVRRSQGPLLFATVRVLVQYFPCAVFVTATSLVEPRAGPPVCWKGWERQGAERSVFGVFAPGPRFGLRWHVSPLAPSGWTVR